MASDQFSVGVNIQVIPDGVRLGNPEMARLSLSITPNPKPKEGEPVVDIRRWPSAIRTLAKAFYVAIGHVTPPDNSPSVSNARWAGIYQPDAATLGYEAKADELWQRIFTGKEGATSSEIDAAFGELIAKLIEGTGSEPPPPPGTESRYGTYNVEGLGRVSDTLQLHSFVASVIFDLPEVTDSLAAAQVRLPLNAGSPNVQFWQGVAKDWLELEFADDAVGDLARAVRRGGVHMQFAGAARRQAIDQLTQDARALAGPYDGPRPHADAGGALAGSSARLRGLSEHLNSFLGNPALLRPGLPEAGGLQHVALAPDQLANLRKELFLFNHTWGVGMRPTKAARAAADAEDAEEASRRKLSAILSWPTLAKFLGCIVDIEMPLPQLRELSAAGEGEVGGRRYGAIAARSAIWGSVAPGSEPDPVQLLWTVYVHRPTSARLPHYFGPCLTSEALRRQPDKDALYCEGLLNLATRMPNGQSLRYSVNTLDVSGSMRSFLDKTLETARRSKSGLADDQISSGLPHTRSRGIELIDGAVAEHGIRSAARERRRASAATDPSSVRLDDVEDLTAGYRIDVALCDSSGGWQQQNRWRTLMARDVRYRAELDGKIVYRDIPENYLTLASVAGFSAREDGHTRMMTGSIDIEPDAGDGPIETTAAGPAPRQIRNIVPHQQVATWFGQSLAIAATQEQLPNAPANADSAVAYPDPEYDLAIDLELDSPPEPTGSQPDRRPAPLRDGRSYMFGARLNLVNGCSLALDDARAAYANDRVVLGASDTTPFTYLRREKIEAPDVLLPWDSPLVRNKSNELRGEAIDVLVIRSGDRESTGSTERFLVPPRVSFDIAEQGGVFDSTRENAPSGAFSHDEYAALLDPETGTFPVARNGAWEFPKLLDPTDPPVEQRPVERSRGSVLVMSDRAKRPKAEFYPDPLARRMSVRFCRLRHQQAYPADGFGPPGGATEFWSRAKRPSDAAPTLLTLRRPGPFDSSSKRGWIDTSDVRAEVPRHPQRTDIDVRELSIILRPAEVVDLEIWSVSDTANVHAGHEIARVLPNLAAYFGDALANAASVNSLLSPLALQAIASRMERLSGAEAADFLEEVQTRQPLTGLQSYRYVRLVHAVEKPLRAPAFLTDQARRLRFHPVVIVAGQGDTQNAAQKSWMQYVSEHIGAEPMLEWPSVASGTTTFFVGALSLDRPSSIKIRCETRWQEFGVESERYDASSRRWEHRPQDQYTRLFQVDHISTEDEHRERDLDLLYDEDGARLRSLSYAFANGKARHLSVIATATSRFTSYFKGGDTAENSPRFEVSSPGFDRTTTKVWVPATIRPAPPVIDRVIPVFRWGTAGGRRSKVYTFSRESSLRVYLKRPWHSSGEGEMLALVCWPPELLDADSEREASAADDAARRSVCDFENLRRLHRFVTRWGADPIRLSGQLDDLISADRIGGYQTKRSNLLLTLASDPMDSSQAAATLGEGSGPVSIAAYVPRLDPDEGLWTVDISIDHGAAYYPFVQLGLARYQPHSVRDLELSAPAAHMAQIPPRRKGTATFIDDRELLIEIHGVGYRRSEAPPGHEAERHKIDVPLLNVRLLRAYERDDIPSNSDRSIEWKSVLEGGQRVEQLLVRPIQRGPEVWWICKIKLPQPRHLVDYGLFVEEVEYMAADSMCNENPATLEDIKFDTSLKERAVFSHIVDLR